MTSNSEYFRDTVLREFEFLEKEFNLKNTPVEQEGDPFTLCYKSDSVQVLIEGINWGANARVAIGRCIGFENYDLYDLVKAQTGKYPTFANDTTLNQITQLSRLSILLKNYGKQVLNGDVSIFQTISKIIEARAKSFDGKSEYFVI